MGNSELRKSRLLNWIEVIVFTSLVGTVNVHAQLANTPWPKFHSDIKNTGYSTQYGASFDTAIVRWHIPLDYVNNEMSAPAVGDGVLYIGSGNYVYAIDAVTGQIIWDYETGDQVISSPAIGSDGTIYVGSKDDKLYALNPDGTLKWSYDVGSNVNSSPNIDDNGYIYFGGGAYLYVLNPDGTLRWRHRIDGSGSVATCPAIAPDGTIYFGSTDHCIYAVNSDGTRKWKYCTGDKIFTTSPSIGADGTIYQGSRDGCLYALNPDGTLKWNFCVSCSNTPCIKYSTPAIGTDGTIYINIQDGYLYALNPDGSVKWKFYTGYVHNLSSVAIGSDGTIYSGSHKHGFYSLSDNGSSVDTVWYIDDNVCDVHSALSIGSDAIFVHCEDGQLYRIEPLYRLSGKVVEDVNGDGDLSDAQPRDGVIVKLYDDDGDNSPDAGDTLVATDTTDADGNYSFLVMGHKTYWLVIDSKTISPSAGYNSGYSIGDVWAEQTYGSGGSWGGALCDNDADPSTDPQVKSSSGPCFGGAYGDRSDGFSDGAGTYDLTKAEHIAKINLGTNDIEDIDFGFSFNVVTNINDQDDDADSNRTCQGCLRQFIQNSNAIQGANHMRFVPVVPTNASGGGNNWWKITISDTLHYLSDDGTALDGTAYDHTDGTTVINPNSTVVTAPVSTVGTEHVPLPDYDGPELEIDGNRRGKLLVLSASNDSVSHLALTHASGRVITIASGTGHNIYKNFVGPHADGTDPGSSSARGAYGIYLAPHANALIDSNLVAYLARTGCIMNGEGITEYNYFHHVALNSSCGDGVTFEFIFGGSYYRNREDVIVRNNYFEYITAYAVESWQAPGGYTVINNTITKTGQGDEGGNYCGTAPNYELGGIRIFGHGSLIKDNVIYGVPGNGVVLVEENGSGSIENRISHNVFYNNGMISIDLDQTNTSGNPNGDGVTPNNGTTDNGKQNIDMDYPIFTKVTMVGDTLHIEGYVGTPSSVISGVDTIEVYKADNDGNNDGEIFEGDGRSVPHGEGRWYIGSFATNPDGTFSATIIVPDTISLSLNDTLTATASDLNGNTSEFSAPFNVNIGISGKVFEDMDSQGEGFSSDDGDSGRGNVLVRLYRDANGNDVLDNSDEFVDSARTDPSGVYFLKADLLNETYFVVVNSKDITPKNGYNSGYGPDTVWAEQTYEKEFINGSYSEHTEFGGEDPTVSDSFSLSSTAVSDNRYEHVARVDVGNTHSDSLGIYGVDFGFSFNVVVNTLDEDQDASAERFAQGSLRQFIMNANGISGANHMRFVPAVPTNASGGGGDWWQITLNEGQLPQIFDDSTTVDGTAYSSDDGITVVNTNPGSVGTGGPVGVGPDGIADTEDDDTLDTFEKPELEINGADERNTFRVGSADSVGDYITIRNLAIYNSGRNGIKVFAGCDSFIIENNFIGVRADGSEPSTSDRINWNGVKVSDALLPSSYGGIIQRNYVGFCGRYNISVGLSTVTGADAVNTIVRENEIFDAGKNSGYDYPDAVSVYADGVKITNNLIHDIYMGNGTDPATAGKGIEIRYGAENVIVENNTIYNAQSAGVYFDDGSDNGQVRYNLIYSCGQSYTTAGVVISDKNSNTVGVKISKNSIHSNNGLSIDLVSNESASDGVTPNDGVVSSDSTNSGMDYPVFIHADLLHDTLHVQGFVGSDSNQTDFANAVIEVFKRDNDGDNNGEVIKGDGRSAPHGEGRDYIGTCSADANGNIDCFLKIPSGVSLVPGDSVTATATNNDNSTSEFGADITVTAFISGKVFEDADGEGEAFTSSDGDEGRANVLVRLYKDANSNGSLDASDVFVDSARTDANGDYKLRADASNTTFFVVVNSKDITPKSGYNPGYGPDTVWAEQTYEKEYISNSYSEHTEFGGEDPTVSDSFSLTSTSVSDNRYEHVARVDMVTSAVADIDFGFSFNVVVNILDEDQDTSAERFAQGSLRQFIINANGISGANHMRFVPAVPTNASGGGGNWWKITLSDTLPNIRDDETIVDGTAYSSSDGVTVRDDNPGQVGTGGNIGVGFDGIPNSGDEPSLSKFDKPELEVDANGLDYGFYIGDGTNNPSDVTIRKMAIIHTQTDSYHNGTAIVIYPQCEHFLIEENLLGVRADGSEDDAMRVSGGVMLKKVLGITVSNGGIIQHNYIVNSLFYGVVIMEYTGNVLGTSSLKTIIRQNEFFDNGKNSPVTWPDAIAVYGTEDVTIEENLIRDTHGTHESTGGKGIEVFYENKNLTIRNNTIRNSEGAGILLTNVEGGTIEYNLIYNNCLTHANGGIVLSYAENVSSNKKAVKIKISRNSFYNNKGLSIDLDQTHTSVNDANGDGVTPNDGTIDSDKNNYDMDYPIFTKANLSGSDLHVEGYVGTSSSYIAGTHTIEIFKADNSDNDQNGEIESGDGRSVPHGEGHWYIGSCTTNSDGTFSCDITVPTSVSLSVGDSITATATDGNDNTSEFSANARVTSSAITYVISGYVFEDANHNMVKDNERGISGIRVELWHYDGASWSMEASTTTNSSGYFDFSPASTGQYRVIEDFNDNAGNDPNSGSDSTGYISTTPNVQNINWDGTRDEIVYFGDYRGSKITGKVFYDAICGANGSTNNNGQFDSGEAGISNIRVTAENSSTLIDNAVTNNDGNYTLWIPYDVTTPFYVIEKNTSDYISTGDHDGQAGPSNAYGADSVEFSSFTSGNIYANYDFGDVKSFIFEPDNSGAGMPGSPVTYSHIMISGSEISVSLSYSSSKGWNWVLFHDTNKNGQLDASDTLMPMNFNLKPCDTLYLIVRTFIPSDENVGQMDVTTFNADVSYANNSNLAESGQVVDVTSISGPLKLTKSVDKGHAVPGDTLSYTITFKNIGTQAIDTVTLTDPIDAAVEFAHDAFGTDEDVEFHYPDGTVIYLKAEEGSDSNNDGAWLMIIGSSMFLRIDFINLDGTSPGPINRLMSGQEGYLVYKVKIR